MPLFEFRAVFVVMLGGLAACSGTAESKPSYQPPPATADSAGAAAGQDASLAVTPASLPYVKTQAVALGADAPAVRAPARVEFRDGAVSQVGPTAPGRVIAVHVATGDRVKAGDPLVTLTSPDAAAARAAVQAAVAAHDAAEREVARQAQMAQSGVGIESERVAAQAQLREATAELGRARATASLLGGGGGSTIVLRAPIAGTVLARHATVGSTVEPGGEPLIELGDPSALWVIADVFDRDLGQVTVGAAVDIALPDDAQPRHGHVSAIGSALSGELHTAPVYVTLDGDGATTARPGMYARATIAAPPGQGIVLPAEAVLVKDGKTYEVFVQRDASHFTPRAVEVGRSIDGKVQVRAGLHVGEAVVVQGALLLDGSAEQLL